MDPLQGAAQDSIQIPRGFKDVLPAEALSREFVSGAISKKFATWGYRPVETPVAELLDVLQRGGELGTSAFTLFDLDGTLLGLRPDMTLPIARVVASRLESAAGPHRLRYVAPVFREQESLRGQAREFTQVGVELVGCGGAAADAEVLTMAAEALLASGLKKFSIAIGLVTVFVAIVRAANMDSEWETRLVAAAHERNFVDVRSVASEEGVPSQITKAITGLLQLHGGGEAIEACKALVEGLGCDDALDQLQATYELLQGAGLGEFFSIDFSLMRSFDYYTGIIFEANAPEMGLPLGGGGRYDSVLAAYGDSVPAAGFALGLERMVSALAAQGSLPATPAIDAVVGGDGRVAFREAARLRKEGFVAVICAGDEVAVRAHAAHVGAKRASFAQPNGNVTVLEQSKNRQQNGA